jgi:hypothetical protein
VDTPSRGCGQIGALPRTRRLMGAAADDGWRLRPVAVARNGRSRRRRGYRQRWRIRRPMVQVRDQGDGDDRPTDQCDADAHPWRAAMHTILRGRHRLRRRGRLVTHQLLGLNELVEVARAPWHVGLSDVTASAGRHVRLKVKESPSSTPVPMPQDARFERAAAERRWQPAVDHLKSYSERS